MFPEPIAVFSLFGWHASIHLFGVFLVLGFLAAAAHVLVFTRPRTFAVQLVTELVPVIIVVGFTASTLSKRLLYSLAGSNEAGTHFLGWAIGSVFAVVAYCRIRRWSVPFVLDRIAPPVLLASGIGRIGCFCGGCCGGFACAPPWGLHFPAHGPEAPAIFPAQLVSSAGDLSLFLAITLLQRRNPGYPGQAAGRAFMAYCATRFGIEFLRTEPRIACGLSVAQVLSVLAMLATVPTMAKWQRGHARVHDGFHTRTIAPRESTI